MQLLAFLLQRAKEPSTWAGFGSLFALLGMSGQQANATASALAALAGLAAVFLPESK